MALTSECSLRLHPFKLTRRSTRFCRTRRHPRVSRKGHPEDPEWVFESTECRCGLHLEKMHVSSIFVSAPENLHQAAPNLGCADFLCEALTRKSRGDRSGSRVTVWSVVRMPARISSFYADRSWQNSCRTALLPQKRDSQPILAFCEYLSIARK